VLVPEEKRTGVNVPIEREQAGHPNYIGIEISEHDLTPYITAMAAGKIIGTRTFTSIYPFQSHIFAMQYLIEYSSPDILDL